MGIILAMEITLEMGITLVILKVEIILAPLQTTAKMFLNSQGSLKAPQTA